MRNYALPFDLQYFQGEKTEKATPKKRKDARDKGQVVQTRDIGSALSLLLVFYAISAFSKFITTELFSVYHVVMDFCSNPKLVFTQEHYTPVMKMTLLSILKLSLPFLLIALVVGVVVNYFQVGFLFTGEPLKFKLGKLNPLKGFKRIFSMKSLVEMLKSILKATGILYLCYNYISGKQNVLIELMNYELAQAFAVIWDMILAIVIRCSIFLLVVAIFDYMYKKWENEKELRMSKQEVKDEYKQMEGDPFIKGKIKEKQRQMAMSRMMQEVPEADVVITNPTHYAVAIKYDRDKNEAPQVVAKGKDLIAANIKKIAREHEVIIVENPPLARALYSGVEIGEEIPFNLYEAVADVLAYVYNVKVKSK